MSETVLSSPPPPRKKYCLCLHGFVVFTKYMRTQCVTKLNGLNTPPPPEYCL